MFRRVPFALMFLYSALATSAVYAQAPFDSTQASVSLVTIGTPTTVTVTSRITSLDVIPTSVQLQRLNANGTVTVMAILRDNGLDGDAVSGDDVFSLRFTIDQPVPAVLTFRVSAGLVAVIRRVVSDPFEIVVRGNQTPAQMLSQLTAQLQQGDMASILSHFSPSSATERVLKSLDQAGREQLANGFANLVLTGSNGDARYYDMPWTNPDGTTETTHVIVAQGGLGTWVVISW